MVLLSLGTASCEAAPEPTQTDAPAASTAPTPPTPHAPADGWGEAIAWRSFADGKREALATKRPLMLVVWTPWCANCRKLKKNFSTDPSIQKHSKDLVMVNVNQEDLPEFSKYGPDGDYIPRILFFSPEGTLDESILNEKRSRFRYFYSPVDSLSATMQEAKLRHAHTRP